MGIAAPIVGGRGNSGLMKRLLSGVHRIRRRILLHRRLLAALAVAAAVWLGSQLVLAPPAQTVSVWTLADDRVAGEVVQRSDLHQVDFLPDAVPSRAITGPEAVVGKPLAHALAAGQPLTTSAVLGRQWVLDQGGLSIVPARITDAAVVGLLRAGDEVDLYATDVSGPGGAARLVAAAVRVVAVPPATHEQAGQPIPGRLILVGVTPEQVADVTRASAGEFLSIAWAR